VCVFCCTALRAFMLCCGSSTLRARYFEAVPSCQQKQPQSNETFQGQSKETFKRLLRGLITLRAHLFEVSSL